MKVSYQWLKEWINISDGPEKVAEILTELGLEVGSVEQVDSVKGGLRGLVIGQVLTCEKHPDADKLKLTTVDIGSKDPLQIVCGAPNVAAGLKVVVATMGTVLYSGSESFEIRKSKIRGVVSEGMLCGEVEIGIGTNDEGLLILEDSAKVGDPLTSLYPVQSDSVIEIDITPNRADALGHYGVARDLAAYYESRGVKVDLKKPAAELGTEAKESLVEVNILDQQACPKYVGASLKGVKVAPSPSWLQNRLKFLGLKPINNVVDVTNLVLMELGQPLHAFDAKKLGGVIEVSRGMTGKDLLLLDGTKYQCAEDDLVITNGTEPICLAGVMGGMSTAVDLSTTDVFLEAAYFNPVDVRTTSKRAGVKSDSSYRFERGVDPNSTELALNRAIKLLQELAGAELVAGPHLKGQASFDPFKVKLRIHKCQEVLGVDLSAKEIEGILDTLEIKHQSQEEGVYLLEVPAYRVDVQREADVIEEILRVFGYNNVSIPTHLNAALANEGKMPQEVLREKVSDILVGSGFTEILNNSLTKGAYFEGVSDFEGKERVTLLNPLSNDLNTLRMSLLFGGLESIARNQNMKAPDLKLFEFGKTYWKQEGKYNESSRMALFMTGNDRVAHWKEGGKLTSFYSLKGLVEGVIEKIGNPKVKVMGLSSELCSDGLIFLVKKEELVRFGQVAPKWVKQFGIKQPVYFADFNWQYLHELASKTEVKYQPLNKFHPVKRDLSLLLDRSIGYDQLQKLAFQTDQKHLSKVELFDVYQGDKLPSDKKSYALSFELSSTEATLKDEEIDQVMKKLIHNFEKQLGAQLR